MGRIGFRGSKREKDKGERIKDKNSLYVRLISLLFRLLYYEMAWTYDAVSWVVSLGDWRRWQFATLDYVKGKSILELGHGTGHVLKALQDKGLKPMGLDLSPQMGFLAHKRTKAHLVRGSAESIPYPSNTFDTIISTFPTPYIISETTRSEIFRVLKPKGRLVIVPSGWLKGQSVLVKAIELAYTITGQGGFDSGETWDDWTQTLRASGFLTSVNTVSFERSGATVILAIKPEESVQFSP